MTDSPEAEEGLCTTCSKFWATITGKFFWYTKGGKEGTKMANEASSACKVCALLGNQKLLPSLKDDHLPSR